MSDHDLIQNDRNEREREATVDAASEAKRPNFVTAIQSAKDELAAMTKLRDEAAVQVRILEARVRGFQYDISKARRDRLEMMKQAKQEIFSLDCRIDAMAPQVEAYRRLVQVLDLASPRGGMMESRSHFLGRLEEEIGKAQSEVDAENAKAAAKVEAELPDFLKTKKG